MPALNFPGVTVSGWVACVCGSLAALIAESVCTPLDVVRTRIMCLEKAEGIKATNPFAMLRNILANEGIGSLLKGRRLYYSFFSKNIVVFFYVFVEAQIKFQCCH